jgi:hypothetical protein
MRPPLGEQPSRRITQRNLFAVLQCLDMENPGESPLLKASVGSGAAAAVGSFPGRYSAEYEQLSQWVYQVSQKPMPVEEVASGAGGVSFADLAGGLPAAGGMSAAGGLPAAGGRPVANRPTSHIASGPSNKRGNEKAAADADNTPASGDVPDKPPAGGRLSGAAREARKKAVEKAAMDAVDPYDPATFNNQANSPTELPTPASRVLNGAGK